MCVCVCVVMLACSCVNATGTHDPWNSMVTDGWLVASVQIFFCDSVDHTKEHYQSIPAQESQKSIIFWRQTPSRGLIEFSSWNTFDF